MERPPAVERDDRRREIRAGKDAPTLRRTEASLEEARMRPSRVRARVRLVAVLVLAGCGLPKNVARPQSSAIAHTQGTALGALISPAAALHPGESGFLLFNTGEGAIQARVALADVAQSSIDAQYFEWAGDALGRVLMARVIAAADRGVRVRLLIDDYNNKGHDIAFEALAAHPNIEVRVFNPFVRGRLRVTQLLGRFTELNRRMHNKMFVVDGQAAIVGGRNLTDDYFGMGKKIDFRDFDLLAIGTVVPQAEDLFDRYWNSEFAYPIGTLRKPATRAQLEEARRRFMAHVVVDRNYFPYALPADEKEALTWLEKFRGRAVWGLAEVLADDPGVVAKKQKTPSMVANKMRDLAKHAEHEIVIENAYFLPQKEMPGVTALRQRGIELKVLTNSLATTDEVAVNAHYAGTRPRLVDLGVALYEMKPDASSRELYIARPTTSKAHLALHGKAAVFDREVVFVGSFNLDPRSLELDTETVFVVYSPELARQFLDAFATDFEAENAWHLGGVVGRNKVAWVSQRSGQADVEPHDPASGWLRFVRSILSVLPIRSLL
jgi:putative cardiolipin synthase